MLRDQALTSTIYGLSEADLMLRDQIGFTQAIDSRGKGDTRRCDMGQNLLRCAGIFGHTCFSLRYILNNRCLISLSLAPVFRAVQGMQKVASFSGTQVRARAAGMLPWP